MTIPSSSGFNDKPIFKNKLIVIILKLYSSILGTVVEFMQFIAFLLIYYAAVYNILILKCWK